MRGLLDSPKIFLLFLRGQQCWNQPPVDIMPAQGVKFQNASVQVASFTGLKSSPSLSSHKSFGRHPNPPHYICTFPVNLLQRRNFVSPLEHQHKQRPCGQDRAPHRAKPHSKTNQRSIAQSHLKLVARDSCCNQQPLGTNASWRKTSPPLVRRAFSARSSREARRTPVQEPWGERRRAASPWV